MYAADYRCSFYKFWSINFCLQICQEYVIITRSRTTGLGELWNKSLHIPMGCPVFHWSIISSRFFIWLETFSHFQRMWNISVGVLWKRAWLRSSWQSMGIVWASMSPVKNKMRQSIWSQFLFSNYVKIPWMPVKICLYFSQYYDHEILHHHHIHYIIIININNNSIILIYKKIAYKNCIYWLYHT